MIMLQRYIFLGELTNCTYTFLVELFVLNRIFLGEL